MAKIVIAELDIDVQAMLASTSQVKKSIDDLKKSQAELVKSGDTNSKAFVENASNLKVLNAEYTAGVKALADNTKATADQANRTELLNIALQGEVSSIAEARAQNTLLNKLRNETNVTTEEGKAQLIALNNKLNENNAFIKENADAYLKQKIGIGDYTAGILEAYKTLEDNKKALIETKVALEEQIKQTERGSAAYNLYNQQLVVLNQQINNTNTEMSEARGEAQNFGGSMDQLKGSFQGVANGTLTINQGLTGVKAGFIGAAKAGLAFIMTPVGAVLAVLVGAFALIKGAMNRSEDATNKIKVAFSVFSGITNSLLKMLQPLGEFLINGIVKGFEFAGKAADKAMSIISGGLKFLGFNDTANSISNFSNELKKSVKDAETLTKAEIELEKAQRKSRLIQLDYQKNAEKFRQIRDDESKSIAERIKANEDLGAVLKLQLKDELAIAKTALLVANLRIKAEGKNKETLDEQAAALTQIADIQERVTGQESEQLVNRVSLQKDAAEKSKAAADKATDNAIAKSKTELEFFIASQGIKAKSLEDELKLAEQVRDKKLAILKTELDKGKITQAEYNLQALTEKQTFLKAQADITVANADIELKAFIDANKSKLDSNKFLSDELVTQEKDRINRTSEAEAAAATARLVAGQINAQQYTDAIKAIDDKAEADNKVLADAKIAADLEKNAIDQENKIAATENEFAQKQADLDRARQQELDAAEKTGADKDLINKKYAVLQKQLDTDLLNFKLNSYSQTLSMIKGLFGEQTALGKAAAIAEVGINTYMKANESFTQAKVFFSNPLTAPLGVNAAIQGGLTIAGGAATVAKIAGVKFEKGGIQEVGGQRHAQGGTKFWGEDGTMFEAEQGEGIGVLNRGAFASFMDFNNSHGNGKSTPTFMAGGGIITQGVQSQSNGMNADDILNIIKSMPAPIVAVTDIHSASDNYARVVNGADF